MLAAVRRKMLDQGVEVIGVSLDTMPKDEFQHFVHQHGVDFPILLAGADAEAVKGFLGYGGGLPESHIFDTSGAKRKTLSGTRSEIEFEVELRKYLRKGPTEGSERIPPPPEDGTNASAGSAVTAPLLKAYVMGRKGDQLTESLLAEVKKSHIKPERIFFFDTTSEDDLARLRGYGYEPLPKPGVLICTDQMCALPAFTPDEVRSAIEEMEKSN